MWGSLVVWGGVPLVALSMFGYKDTQFWFVAVLDLCLISRMSVLVSYSWQSWIFEENHSISGRLFFF